MTILGALILLIIFCTVFRWLTVAVMGVVWFAVDLILLPFRLLFGRPTRC